MEKLTAQELILLDSVDVLALDGHGAWPWHTATRWILDPMSSRKTSETTQRDWYRNIASEQVTDLRSLSVVGCGW